VSNEQAVRVALVSALLVAPDKWPAYVLAVKANLVDLLDAKDAALSALREQLAAAERRAELLAESVKREEAHGCELSSAIAVVARERDTALARVRELSEALPGHGEPCFYCSEPCDALAGNPGRWPISFAQPDGTGVCRTHHSACVVKRLSRAEAAEAREAALREALRPFASVKLNYEVSDKLGLKLVYSVDPDLRASDFRRASAALAAAPVVRAFDRVLTAAEIQTLHADPSAPVAGEVGRETPRCPTCGGARVIIANEGGGCAEYELPCPACGVGEGKS